MRVFVTVLYSLSALTIIYPLVVYALYNRCPRIGIFLVSWFVFTLGVNIFVGMEFIQALKLDSNCVVIETPKAITTYYRYSSMNNARKKLDAKYSFCAPT